MQNVIRTLAGVLLAFFSSIASAGTEYTVLGTNADVGWHASASAACSAWASKRASGNIGEVRSNDTLCVVKYPNVYAPGGYSETDPWSIGTRQNNDPPPSACPSGQTTINATVGYAKVPGNAGFDVAKLTLPPREMAQQNGGSYCRVTLDLANPTECWGSMTPGPTGLYRLSCDYIAERGGQTDATESPELFDLTKPAAASNPKAAPPACDGDFGTINGKPQCVARLPEASQPKPTSIDDAEFKYGNPKAGANGIPAEGTGTAAGGPANSGDGTVFRAGAVSGGSGTGSGTKGDGNGKTTTEAGKEQLNCGAPGQAKCKIDETGTPEGKGLGDEATKAAKAGQDKVLEAINGAKDKTAPAWTFSFRLPTGCTPIEIDAFGIKTITIDPCRWQAQIHDIMAMIWLGVTAWALIGMVGRTLHSA